MSMDKEDNQLDLSEKGRAKNGKEISLDRRLFMQFLAFGGCTDTKTLIDALAKTNFDLALYSDINDPRGVGMMIVSEGPDIFVGAFRDFLNSPPFSKLELKPEYAMLGRTYSLGYEPDLEKTLLITPRERVLDPQWPWVVWYPLMRNKAFETLSVDEQRSILGEHGKLGFKFGHASYAKDVRLACHGLDKNDNDFVIGLLGKDLAPLSILVQTMRKTKQTSMYLESLGPFFVGKVIWQSKI